MIIAIQFFFLMLACVRINNAIIIYPFYHFQIIEHLSIFHARGILFYTI